MKRFLSLPNILTSARIVCAALMPFFALPSTGFYVVYTFGGLTDAVDGTVARKLKLESEFGAKLDSVADLLFYAVMLLKLLPHLIRLLPAWLWWSVGSPCHPRRGLCLRVLQIQKVCLASHVAEQSNGACAFPCTVCGLHAFCGTVLHLHHRCGFSRFVGGVYNAPDGEEIPPGKKIPV